MSGKEDSQSIVIKKSSPIFIAIFTIIMGFTGSFVVHDHQKIVELDSARVLHEHKIKNNSDNHDALMRENALDHKDIKDTLMEIREAVVEIKSDVKHMNPRYKGGMKDEKDNRVGIASHYGYRMRELQDKKSDRRNN